VSYTLLTLPVRLAVNVAGVITPTLPAVEVEAS